MSKLSSDSNASALDTGLETVLLFVEMAPLGCVRQCADRVCDAVIDKALSANKASSQQRFGVSRRLSDPPLRGKAIILKLIEVDDPTTCANILLSKFTDKKVTDSLLFHFVMLTQFSVFFSLSLSLSLSLPVSLCLSISLSVSLFPLTLSTS
jgi:hypothetical protein